jgi:hypothetical protein
MAAYSGTPLPKKLGMKEGHAVLLCRAPAGFDDALGDLPPGVTIRRTLRSKGPFDVIVFFTESRADIHAKLAALRARMAPACGLWFCWPKRASRVPTDVTEDIVRGIALDAGLVDNKVCAVDETWSGLRVVIRREDRPGK